MDEQIRQIGERLRGLREVLDIPAEEVAELCGITLEHYQKIEAGEADPSVYRLSKISKRYGIALDVLMFGEEPRMSSYFLTRNGQGMAVERRKSYKYQSLASGFRGRKFDTYMTQVDPLPDDAHFNKNAHDGQEFDYIVEGRMEITIGNKVMVLGPGDSIFFDASQPHCMRALDGRPVKFLVVVE
ncbi:MAG: XRE family transcriptional regulator [Prevotella sp.]|nr:XRE family transcriptional regulator [Prevotella sp.]MDE6354931.1 XRE family transcriptional regulator [Prevotella sp.]